MAVQPSAAFDLQGGALNAIHEVSVNDNDSSSTGPEAIEDEQPEGKPQVPLHSYPREVDTEESSAETPEEFKGAALADPEDDASNETSFDSHLRTNSTFETGPNLGSGIEGSRGNR
jgi:hypothetical protein